MDTKCDMLPKLTSHRNSLIASSNGGEAGSSSVSSTPPPRSSSSSRVSAEEMDEIRQQNIAYEYLCHLEEAKKWIEACLCEELPATTEFEEYLRNGVYLAKLSNYFCPERVPFKKIYDKDQTKFKSNGLQFRHTDNINLFFQALDYIGLPKIFIPETTDIYDKKNMPRIIYCLHALSLYLFKLDIAPQIQDLYGVAKFTEEEITAMAKELKKYGLQLPSFGKIGGILANEMPVDEVALHAAIVAINYAIEKNILDEVLASLKLHDARLSNISDAYVQFYQRALRDEKLAKMNLAETKSNHPDHVPDVYDDLLTQSEIQLVLNRINDEQFRIEINESIVKRDSSMLLRTLKSRVFPLENLIDKNVDMYLSQLLEEKETNIKFLESINRELVQKAINLANVNAEQLTKYSKITDSLNASLLYNQRDDFISTLRENNDLLVPTPNSRIIYDIDYDYASSLIFVEFKNSQDQKQQNLSWTEFVQGIVVLRVTIDINRIIDNHLAKLNSTNDTPDTDSEDVLYAKLANCQVIENVRAESSIFKRRYLIALSNLKQTRAITALSGPSSPALPTLENSTSQNVANSSLNDDEDDSLTNSSGGEEVVEISGKSKTNSKNAKSHISASLSDSGHSESSFSPNAFLTCGLLSRLDIQNCIAQSNMDYDQECFVVSLINESLAKEDNIPHILYLLKRCIHQDEKLLLVDQNAYLYFNELKKQKMTKDLLNSQDIKQTVRHCNQLLESALTMTKTMVQLNQVDLSKRDDIMTLLKEKTLGLQIDMDCAGFYYEAFKEQRKQFERKSASSGYFCNKTMDGYDFYLNLANPSSYSWTQPTNYSPINNLITRSELEQTITNATKAYQQNLLYSSNLKLIMKLQALTRGYLTRKMLKDRSLFYQRNLDKIIKIQKWWRYVSKKNSLEARISYYEQHIKQVVIIQSLIRMWLQRNQYKNRVSYLMSQGDSAIKIQSCFRAHCAKKDYISLMNDKYPPLRTVRKFVYLLEHNNSDFTEEIELQELRRQIITTIKLNKNLEQDLDMMDVKIGLLVKNRITLQDVLMQHKKLKKYNKDDIEQSQTGHIKQLNKENHDRMELYQNLFYLLQTNPVYLAKLLYALPATNSSKFIETIVLQLFNYGANAREEYLLLKLLTTALQQEIESKVDKVSDIITNTPLVVKVIISFYRKHRGENILRNLLNQVTEEFLAIKDLKLCLSPSELYKAWVNKIESETGVASGMPYDVNNQKALEHEEIRKQLEQNIKAVRLHTARFLNLIIKSLDKLPYGLRYIARVLRYSLKAKFPATSDREILKIIGNLIYYKFLNSAICSPDAYDIIDMKAGDTFDTDKRKNLACIAKHLQLISMSKGYGDSENAHLACMNPFIKESHELIRNFFYEVCNVSESDEYFGINEYSDLIVLTKPIIYMTVQEIRETYKILVEYLDKIAPSQQEPLREIVDLLAAHNLDENEESRASLTSQVSPKKEAVSSPSKSPNKDDGKCSASSSSLSKNTQLCLTLTNRFTPHGEDKLDLNNLFIKTKRMIVEIIHCQSGENLDSILNTPATPEQEKLHKNLMLKRQQNDKLLNIENSGVSRILYGSLEEMKQQVKQNLVELEKAKLAAKSDNYQLIIGRIAQDVRNQRKHRQRRQKELAHLQEVCKVLQKKHSLLKEQVSYYNEYVKACLDRYDSKKKSKNPFKRNKMARVSGSIKYTAAKLYEKGVILEIEGLEPNQFKGVTFEISTTDEPGVFEVTGEFMGVTMDKYDLEFQDLLQKQFEGVSIMRMFDKAKINVNLLIFLINKKFYSKSK